MFLPTLLKHYEHVLDHIEALGSHLEALGGGRPESPHAKLTLDPKAEHKNSEPYCSYGLVKY